MKLCFCFLSSTQHDGAGVETNNSVLSGPGQPQHHSFITISGDNLSHSGAASQAVTEQIIQCPPC